MAERPALGTRVVLVTGAAGQIGTALVRRFAAAGFHTAGTDLAAAPPHPGSPGPGAVPHLWCPGDVTSTSDLQRVVDQVLARWGRLDVLVINAGVTALGRFDETSDEVFTRVVDVNVHGAARSTRVALPALRQSRGRVVVLSSVAGFAPVAGRPAYSASKHAVTGLFESIRHELRADNVSLTMVYPSFLRTAPANLNAAAAPAMPGPRSPRSSTTGRLLDADEVAARIVDAVRRGRPRIRPGRVAQAACLLYRLSPSLYSNVMLRRVT